MEGRNEFLGVLKDSLYNAWGEVIEVIPDILGALIIFIIGLVIASILGKLAVKIIDTLKVDEAADKVGVKEAFGAFGNFSIAGILGVIVKWFFIIVFLIAAADFLNWNDLTNLLNEIVLYIPNIIIAVFILAAGLIVGKIVGDFVTKSIEGSGAGIRRPGALGLIAKWALVLFAALAALEQLNIVPQLVEILFAGIILALALAFGLGGRDKAREMLSKM